MLTTDVSIIRTATGTREKQRAPTSSSSPSTGQTAGGARWACGLGGRIVVDANNPIEAPLFKPVDLKGARLCKAVQKRKGS